MEGARGDQGRGRGAPYRSYNCNNNRNQPCHQNRYQIGGRGNCGGRVGGHGGQRQTHSDSYSI